MAVWSTKYVNDLPDSSFAFIAEDGERLLPYKDAGGTIDPAHVRNALARLDQTDGIPADKKAEIRTTLQNALSKVNKTENAITGDMFILDKIELDQSGQVPDRIQIMETGNWPNSVKGDFSISLDDLKQIKDNFDNGIGFPTEDASTGLAIDFMHNYDEEAAGWIKGLELQVDPSDPTKGKLFASPVEWSDAGAEAVRGGKFKMLSPSGYFGSKNGKQMSMWANPRNLKEKVANVLDGAGLTNIPFLRGMAPIRADRLDESANAKDNVIYVVQNQQENKEQSMQLDALRVKEREDLTVPELDFLAEQKDQLSAAELAKFKLDADDEGNEDEQISEEDKQTLAAIKEGTKKLVDSEAVVANKSELDALKSTAAKYEDEKAQEIVNLHIKRGAIKQDSADNWKKRLLAATGEEREALEADLKALPDNKVASEELGTGEDVSAGSTAREQLDAIAKKKVADAAKDGKEVLYADALKEALRENADLATADTQDQKVKVGA